jgi:predicted alpha-1,6-mannanase (GH76 family)
LDQLDKALDRVVEMRQWVDKTLLDSRIDDFIDDRVTEFAFLADWKPLTWISL